MKKFTFIFVMVCMLVTMVAFMPMSASAASKKSEPKWYEKFTPSGNVTIDEDEETVTLTSNKGDAPAGFWYTYDVSKDFFDIEWTMTTVKRAGNENFTVSTGTQRVYMTPGTSTVSVMGGAAIPVQAPLGSSNTYRLIWEDGAGEFYFNDELAGKFTLTTINYQKGFGFWISGINGDTQLIVEHVSIYEPEVVETTPTEPEPEKEYVPCYDYTMEFDDPAVVQGEEWKNSNPKAMQFKNGLLDVYNHGFGSGFIRHWFGTPENFTLTMKYRMESIGDNQQLVVLWPSKRVTIAFHEDYLKVNNTESEKINIIDGEWHIMKVESWNDGNNVSVYIDDKMLFSGAAANDTAAAYESQWHLNFSSTFNTTRNPCIAQVDWIRCVGVDVGVKPELVTPMANATYLEGEKINLKVSLEESSEVSSVDFIANGNVIATAAAPDFEATVTDLQPGKYRVYAKTEKGAKSSVVNMKVTPAVQGDLKVTSNGNGIDMQVELFDRYQNVKEVEYFIDGVSVGKTSAGRGDKLNVADVIPSAHTLLAVFLDENGRKVGETSIDYINDVNTDKGSASYMNELDYTVTGNSGTAVYEFSNGTHKVRMTHSVDKVVYLSDTGEKTFHLGTGNFKILTDGATAEVYRNGQMAFSYYLPMTEEMGRSVQENGMKITNVTTSIPESKKTYFAKRNVTEKSLLYNFAELPYYHNTEFIADENDDVRLVINDGYYRSDVELKDGKIYVRKTDKDRTVPYREEVSEVQKGKVYYRIEVAAGMVRLYANGRWLTSFRAEHAEGDKFLAVQVNGGDGLDYITVHDNEDLYFYADDFQGTGENESVDFWMYKGVEPYVNEKVGMLINALGQDEAYAEVSASVGNLDFTADVEVTKEKGGVYILFNKAVSTGYSKIGYNFEEKQYELVDRNGTTFKTKKAVPGEFPLNEPVQLRLKVVDEPTGKTAVLYVNGQEVLNCEKGLVEGFRGRFGFILDDNTICVSNVSYRGDAYVNIGMTETVMVGPTTDVLELEEDKIILTGYDGSRRYTEDGGKTWKTEAKPDGETWNNVQLRNPDGTPTGSIVAVSKRTMGTDEVGIKEYSYIAYRSDDNGETYREVGKVHAEPKADRGAMQNRLTQGPSGRLYFASSEENSESRGAERAYYSDDNGNTWKASETYISFENTGFVIAEGKIIEMGDGVVRYYIRTDLGQIIYFESYDYGKTFDLTKAHSTPFLSATNCYNVEVDPYNPDHIYIAWGYDNANLNSTVQHPRTRFGVAMSPDCGKTWHYIGTAHENNSIANNMMNLSINVTKNYIAVGQCFSSDSLSNVGNSSPARTLIIPKNKIKPLMDFEQVHMRWEWISQVVTMTSTVKQDLFLASPASGTVLLHGELVTDATYDDMIALDVVASYGGTKEEIAEDGSAILTVGEKNLTIPAGSIADKGGKKYVDMETFAKLYGLVCVDYEGVKVFDRFGRWSQNDSEMVRAMVEMFPEYATKK